MWPGFPTLCSPEETVSLSREAWEDAKGCLLSLRVQDHPEGEYVLPENGLCGQSTSDSDGPGPL